MKKRRHHYVWRKYLLPWTVNNKIWCFREGKIFSPDLMGVGQERDFYKLQELTLQELELLRKLALDPLTPKLRMLNEGWVQMFHLVFELKKTMNDRGLKHPEIERFIDESIHNFEEDYHAEVEGNATKYIDLILGDDTSFYKTEDGCLNFSFYICLQYMRTKKLKENVCSIFHGKTALNIDGIWNIMRHIYATNMAWTLYAERSKFKMVLLKNVSSKTLITCDQPVINTYAADKVDGEKLKDVEFYYPVSPVRGILISDKEQFKAIDEINLNHDDVDYYNRVMLNFSHEQIYANSRETLEFYCL
jgi:hypothetical protein